MESSKTIFSLILQLYLVNQQNCYCPLWYGSKKHSIEQLMSYLFSPKMLTFAMCQSLACSVHLKTNVCVSLNLHSDLDLAVTGFDTATSGYWPRGQSSPGSLQSGQQASNCIRHIPQLSSLATHRHTATAVSLHNKLSNDINNIDTIKYILYIKTPWTQIIYRVVLIQITQHYRNYKHILINYNNPLKVSTYKEVYFLKNSAA